MTASLRGELVADEPLPLLDRTQVEILGVGDAPEPSASHARWTCPMCAREQLVVHARFAVIRERNGTPMERQVLLCAPCLVGELGVHNRPDSPEPSRSAREGADAQ